MSLPPRAAALYVVLANTEATVYYPPGGIERDNGTILSDWQTTGATHQAQQMNFASYQSWFTKYPKEAIAKVQQGLYDSGKILAIGGNFIRIGKGISFEMSFKCPDDWVVGYNPGNPDYDPVPDPNGETGNLTGAFGPHEILKICPRWHTDTPFNYSDNTDTPPSDVYFGSYVPTRGKTYIIGTDNFDETAVDFIGSWDIQAENNLSQVRNYATGLDEYYPYKQATTEFKQTAKFSIPKDWILCCWNDGAIIRGKVSIYSADVETGPEPATGYGFLGISAKIGDEFTYHSEVDWEVTIKDGYIPTEIELPKVAGKVTFVNDFWVTEVVPAGG